ncbi:MAG: 6-carboxytetrahydropterin synthase [Chitinophagaceae bacterium]|nr:6-carboxytetrahydropterin synthase [Chitinophagaceae bacterium]
MLSVTKIFRFEMAHALYGYAGKCKNIHGHSYVLHVTVTSSVNKQGYLPAPGLIFDFKDLKKIVDDLILQKLDHQLVLSGTYLNTNPAFMAAENLLIWEMEPSVENILLFIRQQLQLHFPGELQLLKLKLFETADSCAEWGNAL